MLAAADFPLMPPSQIADAVVAAVTSGETGQCWVCQPGREALRYEFRDVPGPTAPPRAGAAGLRDETGGLCADRRRRGPRPRASKEMPGRRPGSLSWLCPPVRDRRHV